MQDSAPGAPKAASLYYALAWLAGRLPRPLAALAAGAGAWLIHRRNGRSACVARCNVELVAPGAGPAERERLVRGILRGTLLNTLDTLRFWTHAPHANLRRHVRAVHGEALYAAALADSRGLIVAAPHYGNWELLNQYLADRAPISIVYAAPESATGDAFLRRVRGGQPTVSQVRAEPAAVRALWRTLAAGGQAGILPDQQPKRGEGAFAPFFGRQALTMTLLTKLAARTGATVLFGYAERNADGSYDIHFEAADPALAGDDDDAALAALNAGVERIARRDIRQYQWTYKRFSIVPADDPAGNPYWPQCYPNRRKR
ncbi:lipid A biosynthesis lauroyl acyltransferase [Coralloluteibacterium thermophilus]|uniref:Lipid A biosynthesis lauroyl acyltransferase n=1 Tax=Coralloluteibacterium thermophilum TaxID=2707049 RepID=A0ABV9NFF5_9GAMM